MDYIKIYDPAVMVIMPDYLSAKGDEVIRVVASSEAAAEKEAAVTGKKYPVASQEQLFVWYAKNEIAAASFLELTEAGAKALERLRKGLDPFAEETAPAQTPNNKATAAPAKA